MHFKTSCCRIQQNAEQIVSPLCRNPRVGYVRARSDVCVALELLGLYVVAIFVLILS